MPQLTHDPTAGNTVTVESPTIEDALADITARLGSDAKIIDARKVTRGGVAGFFSREMVQVSARSIPEAEPIPEDAPEGRGLLGALERITGTVDLREEADFRDVLQQRIGDAERAQPGILADATIILPGAAETVTTEATATEPDIALAPAAPIEFVPDPPRVSAAWRTRGPAVPAPAGMGRVDWSAAALVRLGLPAEIVRTAEGLDPRDDLGWVEAIAEAAAPYCGPLPDVPTLIVGPGADRLAAPLGLASVTSPEPAPADESWCATMFPTSDDLEWLRRVRGSRSLHLVVGDERWHDLMIDTPVAASWVTDGGVAGALYLAAVGGCPLGFGTSTCSAAGIARATPLDVALAVRRLVARR